MSEVEFDRANVRPLRDGNDRLSGVFFPNTLVSLDGGRARGRQDWRTQPLRVSIAIDDPLASYGLQAMLEETYEVSVIHSPRDLLAAASSGEMDAFLIGAKVAGTSALRLLRNLKVLSPAPVILIVNDVDPILNFEAIRSGASGILLSGNAANRLTDCISEILNGANWYDPMIVSALFSEQNHGASRPAALTPRELELAELVALGATNQAAAIRLRISVGTVKAMLHAIFDKTLTKNRASLVSYLKDHGLA